MSLTLTQTHHHTPSEPTTAPFLASNKRVHTDGPGSHPSATGEGKRRQLSFSLDRGVASTSDPKPTYLHMHSPNPISPPRARSLSESSAPRPSAISPNDDKGKQRVAASSDTDAEEAPEAQPESLNPSNGSGSTANEDQQPAHLDLLVRSFRPRNGNDLIPHRAPSVRVPTVRTPPQELWKITVLQPKDWNANTRDDSSPSSPSPPPSYKSTPTTPVPLTPPGLTKRASNIPPANRELNIAGPSGSNYVASTSSNIAITDKAHPVEGFPSHTSASSSDNITNTTPADISQPADPLSLSAAPELVSWPPPSPSMTAELSLPKVQPYPDWNVPPSPVLQHRHLPPSMDPSSPSPPHLIAPQPRHLSEFYPQDYPSAYSGHFNPFAEWSNEWLVRSRKTYVDYLAKKREKNPYAPLMPSFANPIRASAPSQAWLYLPDTYSGQRNTPRRYKNPLLAYEAKRRSRYACDRYNEPRLPRDFLMSCRHCRECHLDSLCKKLLSLRFNQHQLRLGLLDDEGDDELDLSLPALSDPESEESEVSELQEGESEGDIFASPFDDEHQLVIYDEDDSLTSPFADKYELKDVNFVDVPDSPVIHDLDSFESDEGSANGHVDQWVDVQVNVV